MTISSTLMPERGGRIKKFLRWIGDHAIWDIVKAILASSLVYSLSAWLLEKFQNIPVGWRLFVAFISGGLIVKVLGVWLQPKQQSLSLFTPLQIEAFQLAKELRDFMTDFEPKPVPDQSMSKDEAFDVVFRQSIPWTKKLMSSYALRFEPRVQSLIYKFGEKGQHYFPINGIEGKVETEKDIELLQAAIIALAHRMDGVQLGALDVKR